MWAIATNITMDLMRKQRLSIYLLIRMDILSGPNHTVPSPARVILIFVPSALVFGALMTAFLGKIPMRPVNGLINQLNRLSVGDYQTRLDYGPFWGKHPTLAELTGSFNRLAEELQSTEMLRGDFVNNFSHEFKTPIVSITGFAKLLRRGNLSPQQQEEYLAIIEEESLRLSQMATNVLNLTKVENQTILTDLSTFNLSEQIRSSILLLSGKWEKKGIDFILDFDEHTVTANEELLKQVWINLVDNAVKFSPENGTVEIKVKEHNGMLTVSVSNTGEPLSPESRKKIFNKFYQADESHATEGNGIGLAIVKRVAELHDGAAQVSCGDGLITFAVTIPTAHS